MIENVCSAADGEGIVGRLLPEGVREPPGGDLGDFGVSYAATAAESCC